MVRELKLFLDAGVGCYVIPQNCFITHSHADHAFYLPMLMVGSRDMAIYTPVESARFIDNHINSTFCMNACSDDFDKSWYNLIPVRAGDIIKFNSGGKNLTAQVLQMDHTVPSVGFAFAETRTRLKQHLVGMNGKDLAQMRKNGEVVSEEFSVPTFIYMGDTSIKGAIDNIEVLRTYRTIIIECTFLQEEHRGQGEDAKKHIAWQELAPLIQDSSSDCEWILIHFSMRYSSQEVREFFNEKRRYGEIGSNVIVWV
jgi:ribonuclease BN (tRNA processing enzyme)